MAFRDDFDNHFRILTGLKSSEKSFPWQHRLYEEFIKNNFPPNCDIPTGLGKTSVITIWLLALAHHARNGTMSDFPRRLVYVVNRRTVVDQATREAEQMRDALIKNPDLQEVADALKSLGTVSSETPLAISTLRGKFADNGEWRNDPTRPAVIVGTVDMIGSRLLFSGYGRGFKSRPLHAGFLGQDALLVHDEAHLEPAFQKLIEDIEREQKQRNEFGRFYVMALTATARSESGMEKPLFSEEDRNHPGVKGRFEAKKGVAFNLIANEKEIPEKVAELAKKHKDSDKAILIFLRKLEDVKKVSNELEKAELEVETLTGTLRGWERDKLAEENPVFARFMPKPTVTPKTGTVYLVSTSAGEVGVNISADHMICDLTPFDSMAQRFGRVNRFGDGDACIDIVHCTISNTKETIEAEGTENTESKENDKEQSPIKQRCERTLLLLQRLPKREDERYDASPKALNNLSIEERLNAFTPEPIKLSTSDILFDTWALTSIHQKLPGRPPVADWLHGVAEWEPPETHVAWREEVEIISKGLQEKYKPEDILDDYPLKPHELLRDITKRVFKEIQKLAESHPESHVWIITEDGEVEIKTLQELVSDGEDYLKHRTILLPPSVGGLKDGLLDGEATPDEKQPYDVSDKWIDQNKSPYRCRVWDAEEFPKGMRLIRTIDTRPEDENEEENEAAPSRRYWYWYVRPQIADDDGSRTANQKQELKPHLQAAECFAERIVDKLGLKDTDEAQAISLAAKWHDIGKDRRVWQLSIGNLDYPEHVLAKSGDKIRHPGISNYRHEFGSLLDAMNLSEFRNLKSEVQDLVLHLIAAHHGRARPHFPADEIFDPKHTEKDATEVAHKVPRRYARLQRKYGRWGLAYLESLVRAADILASQQQPQEVPQ